MTPARLAALAAVPLIMATTPALAQAPAVVAPLATPNPHYVSIVMEQDVDRPAAEVWKRIGKFCDIADWFPDRTCQITSGKDGELGAVRTLNGATIEILVGKTELSYSYAQPVRVGPVYNLYHGTLEVRPMTAKTSKLVCSLLFDNSMLADDAARSTDVETRRARFMGGLRNMKVLAEGGSLPPRK